MELKPEGISLDEWRNNASIEQKCLSDYLRHSVWDKFDLPEDRAYLFKKIAFVLLPLEEQNDENCLPEDRKSFVNGILEKCVCHSFDKKSINIGFIFVSVYINETAQICVPLIRVMSRTPEQRVEDTIHNVFVDHVGRVYRNFDHYKESNTWDMCWLCVPEFCYYTSNTPIVLLDQSSRGSLLQVVDNISTWTNMLTSVGMVGGVALSFFPPTAPFGIGLMTTSVLAGAPGAAYGVGRSVNSIVEKYLHKEPVGLTDGEARQLWLTAASALASVGTFSSTKILADSSRVGKDVSTLAQAIYTGLCVGSSSLSAISLVNFSYEMWKKDELTYADIFQISTSLFFFTHSVLSFKTAEALIKEVQLSEITEMKQNLSSEHRETYETYLRGVKESFVNDLCQNQNEIQGQAKFIREMTKIDNLNDFYKHFDIDRNGRFLINKEFVIRPKAFIKLSEADQTRLLTLTKQLNEKAISANEFTRSAKQIMRDNGIKNNQIRSLGQEYLKNKFCVEKVSDIKIGGRTLRNPKTDKLKKLEKVVRHSFHDGDKDYLKVVDKITRKLQTTGVDDYCSTGRQITTTIDKEVKSRMRQNSNPERSGGKAKQFYKKQIIHEIINDETKFNRFCDAFPKLTDHSPQKAVSMSYLKEKYNDDVKIGHTKLENLKPHEVIRLEKVVKYSFHDGDKDCLEVVNKMAEKMQARSPEDYIAIGKHVCKKISRELKSRMKENSNPKRDGGKAKDFYRKQIVNELITDNAKFDEVLDSLSSKINQIKGFISHMKFTANSNTNIEPNRKTGNEVRGILRSIIHLANYLKDVETEHWLNLLNKMAGNIEVNSLEDFTAVVKRLIDQIEENMDNRNSEGAHWKTEDLFKMIQELIDDNAKFKEVFDSFSGPVDVAQAVSSLKCLKEISNVESLSDVKIGNRRYRDLKPKEVMRLSNFLNSFFYKGNEEYLRLVSKMAEKMRTESLDEFFAAGEYVVRQVDLKILDWMEKSNKSADAEGKTKDFHKKQIVNELITNNTKFDEVFDSFSIKIDQPRGFVSHIKFTANSNTNIETNRKTGNEVRGILRSIKHLACYLKDVETEYWLNILNELAGTIDINSHEDFAAVVKHLIDKIEENMDNSNSEGERWKMEDLFKNEMNQELIDNDAKFKEVFDSFSGPIDVAQAVSSLKYLKGISNVESLSDVKIGNRRYRDLKPKEIMRLSNFLNSFFYKGDEEYLRLVSKMAEKMRTESLDEFFAAGEYIVRKVDLKILDRMKKSNKSADAEGKTKDFYRKQIIDELIIDDSEFNQICHYVKGRLKFLQSC